MANQSPTYRHPNPVDPLDIVEQKDGTHSTSENDSEEGILDLPESPFPGQEPGQGPQTGH